MNYNISGDNLQVVQMEIQPNEKVYAEAGTMAYMSGNVSMEARATGGLLGGLKRVAMGESFFLTEFSAVGGPGIAAFAGNVPGKIVPLDLRDGKVWLVQRDAFLCAEEGVTLDIAFQKRLGSIFFGGEGFILERLQGRGMAFIHSAGDVVEFTLGPGQILKVSTGNAVAWEQGVDFDIQAVGGLKTVLFGGEGLFVTTLRGPGRVLLQSMTLARVANAIYPFLPKPQSSGGPFPRGWP